MKKLIIFCWFILFTVGLSAQVSDDYYSSNQYQTVSTPTKVGNCLCCNGTHLMNCEICGGSGEYYQYISNIIGYDAYGNPIYQDQSTWHSCTAGCNGGNVACTCCNGKSTSTTERLYAINCSNASVSINKISGKWTNGQSVFNFYTQYAGLEGRTLGFQQGAIIGSGYWDIEDGLLKIGEYENLKLKWTKYCIISIDDSYLKLRQVSYPSNILTFKKKR